MKTRMVRVRRARDAERLAHQDRAPWHLRLVDRGERTRAVANGSGPFRLEADDEARAIDEMHHREVEGVGEVDEAGDLLRRCGGPAAAINEGIARQHRDGPAIEP